MSRILKARGNDKILEVVLNRPDKKNALLPEFFKEFQEIVSLTSVNGNYRAIVILAEGADFCSGMDLSVFQNNQKLKTDTSYERERFYELIRLVQNALSSIQMARMPVIAAIQGNCLGAGLDMAAACDLRYCTKDAMFRIEETNIGIMADLGSLQRLPRLMPEGVVKQMAFTGCTLSAADALRYGFVNQVFENTDELRLAVTAVAERIAKIPPMVVSSSKRCINYSGSHNLSDSLEYAALLQAAVFDPGEVSRYMKFKSGAGNTPPEDLAVLYTSLDAHDHS